MPSHATSRYLTLISDGALTILALGIALAGSEAWQPLPIGEGLAGGRRGQATVAIPVRAGPVDLRLTCSNRAPMTLSGLSLCLGSVGPFHAAS